MPKNLQKRPNVKFHRSIFISDFHMGHKGFDARACLKFLQENDCAYLYLVGDIIDGWKLKKRWFWTKDCSLIIDELVQKAHRGTKITYVPGNHDDKIRRLNIVQFLRYTGQMKLSIKNLCIHKTADKRKFIVIHGDQFDSALIRGKLSEISNRLYMACTEWGLLNPRPRRVMIDGKETKFSLAKSISRASKSVGLSLMNNLERSIFRLIKNRNVDGLICGHTHVAYIKETPDGIYCNTGCWSGERNSALVENENGRISLMNIEDMRAQTFAPENFIYQEPHNLGAHLPQTQRIVAKIYKLWTPAKIFQPKIDLQTIKQLPTPDFNAVASPA